MWKQIRDTEGLKGGGANGQIQSAEAVETGNLWQERTVPRATLGPPPTDTSVNEDGRRDDFDRNI